MKVYIIFNYDAAIIESVWDSKEKAMEAMSKLSIYAADYAVIERELNKEKK